MNKRTYQPLVGPVQSVHKIGTGIRAINLFINALVDFFHLIIQFVTIGNNKDSCIWIVCQYPLGKPYHCESFAAALGVPDNAALLFGKFHLRLFYTEELIMAANFLFAFVKHYKVMDKIKEASLMEDTEKLPIQFVRELFAHFENVCRDFIKRLCLCIDSVIFPFKVIFFIRLNRAVAQPLGVVASHDELNGTEKRFVEMFVLVGEILPYSL